MTGVFAFLLALALTAAAQSPRAGDPAPDSHLKALDGRPISLADLRGKVVVIDFWATWCAPCQKEAPQYVAWQKQYGPRGLQVIAISLDDDEQVVRKFVVQHNMDYPVAMATLEVAEAYKVLALPVTYVIDRNGKVVTRREGTEDIEHVKEAFERELEKR